MRGNFTALFIFITIIILVDLYSFQALKLFFENASITKKRIIYGGYWVLTAIMVTIMVTSFVIGSPVSLPNWFKIGVMAPVFIIFFSKVLVVIFLLIDDARRLVGWLIEKASQEEPYSLSRNKFITGVGLFIGGSLLSSLLYGIVKGAYNYTVHHKKIKLDSLPRAFEGFKIVQISDLHVGSFVSERPLAQAFEKINQLKPDLILVTGDLVNNIAKEVEPFESVLNKLEAPHGVFSVLGNHDYGDYVRWDSEEEKKENFQTLMDKQRGFGWKLLMDEFVKIEKEGEYFNLVGIQNWGAKARFPKYGNLNKAVVNMDKSKVNILMSHDPSHWDAQVKKDFKYINLTLSGHTHGMQFGIEIPGWIKWSPVKYIYKQWAGLYNEDNQQLYVNRGLGFLGYPGRVGISPEITLLELNKS